MGCITNDCFVNEVKNRGKKMAFFKKTTNKEIVMTMKDEEHYKINNNCHFCGKEIKSNEVRYHCHLTRKYRRPVHSK